MSSSSSSSSSARHYENLTVDDAAYQKYRHLIENDKPKAPKINPTCVGIMCKDGVILGADANLYDSAPIVKLKNSHARNIYSLTENIYFCSAGTGEDAKTMVELISNQVRKKSKQLGEDFASMKVAVHFLKHYLKCEQGHVGTALMLAGFDKRGPSLYSINTSFKAYRLPYWAMGSGAVAAMAMIESHWKEEMNLEDGKMLVQNAIAAGSFNFSSELKYGECVIKEGHSEFWFNYEKEADLKKGQKRKKTAKSK